MSTDAPRRFALIIGAMKSGTTSLFRYLAAHPAVAPSEPKEPGFFTDPARWGPEGTLDPGTASEPGARDPTAFLEAYRGFWAWDPAVHEVALEASTAYTMGTGNAVSERVKSLGDLDFRFIYIMRDPVERLVSHLSHLETRRQGRKPLGDADFEHALDVSRYASRLEAWTGRWPGDVILPLVYERMAADPAAVVDRVQRFLGLAPRPVDPEGLARAHNAREEMAADQALAGLLDRAPWLAPARRWVPGPVLRAVRGVVGRRTARAVELTAAQRERAVEALRPEARRLAEEWGVDTSPWRSVA